MLSFCDVPSVSKQTMGGGGSPIPQLIRSGDKTVLNQGHSGNKEIKGCTWGHVAGSMSVRKTLCYS